MAMTKAELEERNQSYTDRMGEAESAEQRGLYRATVEAALKAFAHIDGMMQYERKYEQAEFSSIPAIDKVLKYAPLLLDFGSLKKVEELLVTCRRIARNTSQDLSEKVTRARDQIWENHRLWSYLEEHPETRQDELRERLGGNQDRWRWVAEAWERMGLVGRTREGGSYRLALMTRMGQVVKAKCPLCGSIAEAPKAMFLEKTACPKCHAKALFVLIGSVSDYVTRE